MKSTVSCFSWFHNLKVRTATWLRNIYVFWFLNILLWRSRIEHLILVERRPNHRWVAAGHSWASWAMFIFNINLYWPTSAKTCEAYHNSIISCTTNAPFMWQCLKNSSRNISLTIWMVAQHRLSHHRILCDPVEPFFLLQILSHFGVIFLTFKEFVAQILLKIWMDLVRI